MFNRGKGRRGGGWSGRRQGFQGMSKRFGNKRLHTGKASSDVVQMNRDREVFMDAVRDMSNKVDSDFGFDLFSQGQPRLGWLLNMLPTTIPATNSDTTSGKLAEKASSAKSELAALEVYFLQQDGSTFKSVVLYQPYFYLIVKPKWIREVKAFLERRFSDLLATVEVVKMEDLDLPNHLVGKQLECLKLNFFNVNCMLGVRREMFPIVERNAKQHKVQEAYEVELDSEDPPEDITEAITDMREYDVPYYTRVSIDLEINVGSWYMVKPCLCDGTSDAGLGVILEKQNIVEKAEPRVLAFDIECTKQPLKFPDSATDHIFMISYMFDGQGYLIINREIVSEDIDDFEYTPKPEYPGPFIVFNEANEEALLRKFFSHARELKPNIWVTYNGDYFDWPFVEARAKVYDMDMRNEIGVSKSSGNEGEYRGRCSVHIDCFYWVQRDSYLPAGSRGLKAVTKAKLGYDPVEVDPEEMVRFAAEKPHHMAAYSVSDAVATFYLFEKYVNLFIFSLCTIIPLGPDDILRKGSGTLCEMLLMVEARRGNIVCPNKQQGKSEKYTENGQLLEQDTYIGGHVECLETGVFRDDINEKFRLDPGAFDELINNIDRDLTFAIEVEHGASRLDVCNYEEVKDAIIESLEMLRDTPTRMEKPKIYHLDVAAMYPNIILTNRLQPCAIVDETVCASCSHNTGPDASCKRKMEWMWRGEYFPCKKEEISLLKNQLAIEAFERPESMPGPRDAKVPYFQLPKAKQNQILRQRIKDYCRRVYRRMKDTTVEERGATICQRENPFYVDTVKAFRDRRYDYKGYTKDWSIKKSSLEAKNADPMLIEEAKNKVLLFDSLQLAHKCILNSFYGYVMRKGARWHSMEMAGVVTHTGGNIIKQARKLVERIGRPLELDTDGIWCILPCSFPENYAFKTNKGKKISISYPCVMLNADVHASFTNHQYQDLNSSGSYETRSECSIYFEVDGPYRCMVLPASQEEGKLLKKRYAVFNHDGSLAELKGFELKRRGELEIIKAFQSQVFQKFLAGDSLVGCYASVAEVANKWLDVLQSHGKHLTDAEVINLISENRSMSRALDDYGDQKSTSISTAKRLSEFLGAEMVKNAGLACKLLIAAKPVGAPTTERAIPTAIFSADDNVKRHFLRKWLKDSSLDSFDVRSIIDWEYYIDRLGKTVQKIITIPAALQNVPNPVPRVQHPDWLLRNIRDHSDTFKQQHIDSMFKKLAPGESLPPIPSKQLVDIEDVIGTNEDQLDEREDEEEGEDDIKSRVRFLKKKWAQRRKQKLNRENELLGVSEGVGRDLSSYIKDNRNHQGYWQILEIREQRTPGLFKVFLMSSNSELQSVIVRVPRVFYFNSTTPETNEGLPPGAVVEKTHRTLPRAQTQYHLYKVTMDERDFHLNKKEMTNFLSRPNVVGTYELNLDLKSRAVINLGCVARVFTSCAKTRLRQNKRGGTMASPFEANELERLVCTTHQYLEAKVELKRIFCFQAGTQSKQVIVMFQIPETLGELQERCKTEVRVDSNGNEICLNLFPRGTKCMVWVSSSFGDRPNVRKALRDVLDTCEVHFPEIEFVDTHTEQLQSVEDCWRGLNQALNKYASQRNGATMVLFQSMLGKEQILARASALHDFPLVHVPGHGEDDRIPALQWSQYLTRAAVERFVCHPSWLRDRLLASRYVHLPLAHIGQDFAVTMADTFYIRMLEHNRHILWATPACEPDLGGLEEVEILVDDENEPTTSVNTPGSYQSYCVELDLMHLAVNTMVNANMVHDIECADGSMALEQLSVGNTNKGFDNEGNLVSQNISSHGILGSANECLSQFLILRMLVMNWFSDVKQCDSLFADELLVHFYRWLCSPKSLMYDPALHKFVHRLMEKVFLQLLAEMRRLGAKIVHANFQSVWIATGKFDKEAAEAYADHIVRTISSRRLFDQIKLVPKQTWHNILFLDDSNYGGVIDNPLYSPEEEVESAAKQPQDTDSKTLKNASKADAHKKRKSKQAKSPPKKSRRRKVIDDDDDDESVAEPELHSLDSSSEDEQVHNGEDDNMDDFIVNDGADDFYDGSESMAGERPPENKSKYEVVLNWNLSLYLPVELQDHFSYIIGAYLLEPVMFRDTSIAQYADMHPAIANGVVNHAMVEDDSLAHASGEFISHLVETDLCQKLFRIVPQIVASKNSISEFPVLAGSHLQLKNPALEFVKSVCAVLSLDVSVAHHVDILKRNLLKLLEYKEFSSAAKFVNPSLKLTLRDVVCSYCNYCTDLDLCRDTNLLSQTSTIEPDDVESDIPESWHCSECMQPYDMEAIENLLVHKLENLLLKFHAQDLMCMKCGQTRADSMSESCECSGSWTCSIPVATQRVSYLPFVNVAKFYRFRWLEEAAEYASNLLVSYQSV